MIQQTLRFISSIVVFSLISMVSYGYELTVNYENESHVLSQAQLKDLTHDTLTTITPWTDKPQVFSGISIASLMKHFDIHATKAYAKALNDYEVEINLNQALAAGAFIVSHVNGEPMKVRNKGPFWIIFPWSDHPHLIERKYQDWSIWQLTELSFH
ncbi:hypothetical protein [Litoribrevibacter albus]|uniref:Oxidoreductase molybdopterin-binding domain-containing protein n=1 Tax=Litoribrevibacter albus TaxID=1473156 RepID=A0AA37SCN9_9GAMM|nr:hypothetical protein [Litoribrevibacter albus]GLQ32964.1 hypothetical protein GCM10007876_34430 [Litoribrevibacter albus]